MTIRLLLAVVLASLWVPPMPAWAPVAMPTIAVIAPAAAAPSVAHGVGRLHAALAARGFRVVEADAQAAALIVRLTIDPSVGCAESLSIARTTDRGRPALDVRGADATGLMYAALD